MAEFTGTVTSQKSDPSNENRQVRFVNERIFLYAPQYTPILMLKGGIMPGPNGERIKVKGLISSKFVPAKKTEWFDKDLIVIDGFLEGAVANGTVTAVNIDDGAGAVRNALHAGMTIKVEKETMYVTAYNTSTRVATVVRGIGTSTGVAHADNVAAKIIASAVEEGSDPQVKLSNQANRRENFMQIVRHDWQVTRSADKIRLFGGRSKAETMAEAAVEHVRELERAITFGVKADTTTDPTLLLNTRPVQTMGGFQEFSANNWGEPSGNSTGRFAGTAHGATISYQEFAETFLLNSFTFSSPNRRKTFVGGSVFGNIFTRFSRTDGNLQTFVRDTAFGVNVTEIVGPAGTIEFLTSGAIQEVETGFAICFDPQFTQWCFLDNTFMVDNAQAKGNDGFAGFFLTEATMQFEAIETITTMTDVTGPA